MAGVQQMKERYIAVCKDHNVQPHPLITKVMEVEIQECILLEKKGETRTSMHMYLAGNNKLITDTRLDDTQAKVLCDWLKNNLYVTSLDLRYNNITDDGAAHIAKLVEETPMIREVNLMCNDICEEGAKHIAKALHKNETVRSLRMTGNKIGNKGGMCFAQALQINTTLEALDLSETDIKTECVIALATVLNKNRTLKALNINRPLLFSHQEETTVHFANMLKVNRGLEELHLMNYDMRDFGVTRLSESLMDNFSLTYLNLSCNRMTRDGAKQLCELLKRNTPLEVLDLGYNRLGDAGALHLAEAIATYNTCLKCLVLVSNEIRGKGLCAIANSLRINSSLTNLYIWGNELEEAACIAFSGLIDTGRLELKNIDVEPYAVDGRTYLSELNHGIRKWYYAGPAYGEQALPELAKFTRPEFSNLRIESAS